MSYWLGDSSTGITAVRMPDDARDPATDEEYQFTCSACEQEIAVNGEMREAILAHGCPVCAAEVTVEQFE